MLVFPAERNSWTILPQTNAHGAESFFPAALNMGKSLTPHFWSTNFAEVDRTPRPYLTLLLKFIEEASSKYRVGQLISPILNLK